MVSDTLKQEKDEAQRVLILVLMEYGLWQEMTEHNENIQAVLILVLMEYGLWPKSPLSLTTATMAS